MASISKSASKMKSFQAYTIFVIAFCSRSFEAFCSPSNLSRRSIARRIIGGDEVEIKDAPYQVSLQYNGIHECGGVLISPEYILSAAHCKLMEGDR